MKRVIAPKPNWLKPLYPWEQQAILVNGRTMAYLDDGNNKARPVLLLHGNPFHGLIGPAVHNAIGKWIDDFPITPDKVLKALGKA